MGQNAPTKKKLVFALRDFNDVHNNLQSVQEGLANEMTAIWQRIMKDGPKKKQLGDYFEFEYVPLPNVCVEE